jgi:hypothetical protein
MHTAWPEAPNQNGHHRISRGLWQPFNVRQSSEALDDSPRRHEDTKSWRYSSCLCRLAESVVDIPASWLRAFMVNLTCFQIALARKRWRSSKIGIVACSEDYTDAPVMKRIFWRSIGSALTVANTLGCGFLEKVYENGLAHELRQVGLTVCQQAGVTACALT